MFLFFINLFILSSNTVVTFVQITSKIPQNNVNYFVISETNGERGNYVEKRSYKNIF